MMKLAQKKYFYIIAYFIILLTVSFPLLNSGVVHGAMSSMWIGRIEELAAHIRHGSIAIYPSAELVEYYGGQINALDTNFSVLVPALLGCVGLDADVAFKLWLVCIQVITFVAATKLFGCIFQEKWVVVFGVLFYMTCPYRLYLCYDRADVGRLIAWMLLPFLLKALYEVANEKKGWKAFLTAVFAFAGIGYADNVLTCIIIGITVLGAVCCRKWRIIMPILVGGILWFPGASRFIKYVLTGATEVVNMPLNTIAEKGYMPGRFFAVYAYPDHMPGLGAGLLLGMLVFGWLLATGKMQQREKYFLLGVAALLFTWMSTAFFPWDFLQRIGAPLLRLISLIQNPNVFFGMACIPFSVLATVAMEQVCEQEDIFARRWLPGLIMVLTVGGTFVSLN